MVTISSSETFVKRRAIFLSVRYNVNLFMLGVLSVAPVPLLSTAPFINGYILYLTVLVQYDKV